MIISLPKHFHLYRDFLKVCSRLAFGAYMYLVIIKIVFSKAHHKKHMLWVLNRIICLDNFDAFLILTSKKPNPQAIFCSCTASFVLDKDFECVKALPT